MKMNKDPLSALGSLCIEFPSIQIKVFIRRGIELIKGALFIVFVTEQKKIYSLYCSAGVGGELRASLRSRTTTYSITL